MKTTQLIAALALACLMIQTSLAQDLGTVMSLKSNGTKRMPDLVAAKLSLGPTEPGGKSYRGSLLIPFALEISNDSKVADKRPVLVIFHHYRLKDNRIIRVRGSQSKSGNFGLMYVRCPKPGRTQTTTGYLLVPETFLDRNGVFYATVDADNKIAEARENNNQTPKARIPRVMHPLGGIGQQRETQKRVPGNLTISPLNFR